MDLPDLGVPLERSDVAASGVRLRTVFAGPEAGPPVVLLHGFPDFWYGWRRQIPALAAAGFRVIAPNQRGYPGSDKPKDLAAYGRDVLADDVVALLDALGIERAAVVGHDWGGIVGWWLGHRHANRLERLVVCNCPHPDVMAAALATKPKQALKSTYVGLFQIPALPELALSAGGYRWLARALRRSARDGAFTDDDLARYRAAWRDRGAMHAMLNWYRAAARIPVDPPRVGRIPVRTALVWGEQDPALSAELAEPSILKCDDAVLIKVPDAGHWVQLDADEVVNRTLLSFLS